MSIPWVKPLYGRQEGAVVGYNPHKPGRPSHTYHRSMSQTGKELRDLNGL
jgi:hypothetical protein